MLESGLRVGLIGEAIGSVTEAETAITMGSGAFQVLATPALIALMESAAVAAIAPNISQDHASVGIEINIKHISATPIGENLVAMAEITRLDNKRIYLEVRAWDEHEMIGVGTHIRYIVDIQEFEERLQRPTD